MTSTLIRTNEAAEMMHVSRGTIRRMMDTGEVEAIDIGTPKVNGRKRQRAHWRIKRDSVENYLRRRSLSVRK